MTLIIQRSTHFDPSSNATASITVCTRAGGFVKTRISEMSFLSNEFRAWKQKTSNLNVMQNLYLFQRPISF